MPGQAWTKEEEQVVIENYGKLNYAEIGELLGRPKGSVRRKAQKIPGLATRTYPHIGELFNRFTIVSDVYFVPRGPQNVAVVRVTCSCNPDVVIERMVKEVVSGRLKSCGCFHSERASEACRKRVTTHGESATTLYRRWRTIHSRCENPNVPSYKDYGARGIYVCDEWKKFEPFRDWALANGYKKGLQIDRKDNDGPYSPNNCHFVTRSVNGNNKRNNVKVTAFGEEKNLAQWARDPRCLIPEQILRVRIWAGWEPERAMTTLSRRQSHKYSNEQKSPN